MNILDRQRRSGLYLSYSRASELPQMVLAVAMIPILALPELFSLTSDLLDLLDILDWFIYACFAVDMLIKLYLAPSALEHLKKNWLDAIVLLLPMLRVFRILRSAQLLRLLRAVRLLVFVSEWLEGLHRVLARRRLDVIMLVAIAVVVICAGLVALFERDAGGSIKGFGDALWWAMATVTTVGYGDATPVTAEGRGVAAFLMIVGIVFYSVLTANIAAHFVQVQEAQADAEIERKLDTVLQRLDELEKRMQGRDDERIS